MSRPEPYTPEEVREICDWARDQGLIPRHGNYFGMDVDDQKCCCIAGAAVLKETGVPDLQYYWENFLDFQDLGLDAQFRFNVLKNQAVSTAAEFDRFMTTNPSATWDDVYEWWLTTQE